MTRAKAATMRDAHDHRQVVLPDRRHRQPAETTQVEDRLGDDGGADQLAEVDAEDGDDRRQRGAQTVLHDDGVPRQALRPSGADEVLTHRLEHARAGEPGVEGREEERERDPGQDHALEPLQRIACEARVRGVRSAISAGTRRSAAAPGR